MHDFLTKNTRNFYILFTTNFGGDNNSVIRTTKFQINGYLIAIIVVKAR